MAKRKVLVFGGARLIDPSYTWFHSALTGGMLHGHPGDVALIVSEDEAAGLKEELYEHHGVPFQSAAWKLEDRKRFGAFAGLKLILDRKPPKGSPPDWYRPYVDAAQAEVEEREIDVREFCGLPPLEAATDD